MQKKVTKDNFEVEKVALLESARNRVVIAFRGTKTRANLMDRLARTKGATEPTKTRGVGALPINKSYLKSPAVFVHLADRPLQAAGCIVFQGNTRRRLCRFAHHFRARTDRPAYQAASVYRGTLRVHSLQRLHGLLACPFYPIWESLLSLANVARTITLGTKFADWVMAFEAKCCGWFI
jgi:hypothetical protein